MLQMSLGKWLFKGYLEQRVDMKFAEYLDSISVLHQEINTLWP